MVLVSFVLVPIWKKKCYYRCLLISYIFIQLEEFSFALVVDEQSYINMPWYVYLMVFYFWVSFVIIHQLCEDVYALYFKIEDELVK
jgi:hypothetical protein